MRLSSKTKALPTLLALVATAVVAALVPPAFAADDTTAPTVTINQGALQVDPTDTSPVVFDVEFSEPVTGVEPNDFAAAGSTAGGPLSVTVAGSGTTYTASVTGMNATGNVFLRVKVGAAQDAAGNPSTASTSTDNLVRWDPTTTTTTTTSTTTTTTTSTTAPTTTTTTAPTTTTTGPTSTTTGPSSTTTAPTTTVPNTTTVPVTTTAPTTTVTTAPTTSATTTPDVVVTIPATTTPATTGTVTTVPDSTAPGSTTPGTEGPVDIGGPASTDAPAPDGAPIDAGTPPVDPGGVSGASGSQGSGGIGGGGLARTGSDPSSPLMLAVTLIVLGTALLGAARRRSNRPTR